MVQYHRFGSQRFIGRSGSPIEASIATNDQIF
jgi:hypothetical protein